MMIINTMLKDIPIPTVTHVSYRPDVFTPAIDYISRLNALLNTENYLANIRPGMRIGIAVGSRGIAGLPEILKIIITKLKQLDVQPFIFPAMGSHGGADAEGQKTLLKKLNITKDEMGCEIKSSMDTVPIGCTPSGLTVHCDKFAWESDRIIVVNRVKPHTSFRGMHESGIIKMLAIGLGKQRGAEVCHRLGFEEMSHNIAEIAETVLMTGKILLGIGIVENARHQVCSIEIALPHEFAQKDSQLLTLAWHNYPKLPFDKADVLVIHEIGKEISGTGFDTNITGRFKNSNIRITRIAVLNLSKQTGGNANGIGRADVTTKKVLDRFSYEETYPNAITSTAVESVKMPMILDNDMRAIQAAIKMSLITDFTKVKLAIIKNTLHLEDIYVSDTLLEANIDKNVTCDNKKYKTIFNEDGNLMLPFI